MRKQKMTENEDSRVAKLQELIDLLPNELAIKVLGVLVEAVSEDDSQTVAPTHVRHLQDLDHIPVGIMIGRQVEPGENEPKLVASKRADGTWSTNADRWWPEDWVGANVLVSAELMVNVVSQAAADVERLGKACTAIAGNLYESIKPTDDDDDDDEDGVA